VTGPWEEANMTEAEWLACGDPRHLLSYLGTKRHSRKELLFYAACCRRVWDLLGECGWTAVRAVEAYGSRQ
jgi:hypothetical protein